MYINEYKDLRECKDCHLSRYKWFDGEANNVEEENRRLLLNRLGTSL